MIVWYCSKIWSHLVSKGLFVMHEWLSSNHKEISSQNLYTESWLRRSNTFMTPQNVRHVHLFLFHDYELISYQCVNSLRPSDAYLRLWTGSSLGSGNGLAPSWCQAITWTNADLLAIICFEINFNWIWIKIVNKITFIEENVFENVYKMTAVIVRLQRVNIAV